MGGGGRIERPRAPFPQSPRNAKPKLCTPDLCTSPTAIEHQALPVYLLHQPYCTTAGTHLFHSLIVIRPVKKYQTAFCTVYCTCTHIVQEPTCITCCATPPPSAYHRHNHSSDCHAESTSSLVRARWSSSSAERTRSPAAARCAGVSGGAPLPSAPVSSSLPLPDAVAGDGDGAAGAAAATCCCGCCCAPPLSSPPRSRARKRRSAAAAGWYTAWQSRPTSPRTPVVCVVRGVVACLQGQYGCRNRSSRVRAGCAAQVVAHQHPRGAKSAHLPARASRAYSVQTTLQICTKPSRTCVVGRAGSAAAVPGQERQRQRRSSGGGGDRWERRCRCDGRR